MLDDETIDRLRDDLLAADFTLDAVTARLGDTGLAALGRNQTLAALDALGAADDPQATLIRLWVLGQTVGRAAAEAALPATLPRLLAAGLVSETGGAPGQDDLTRAAAAGRSSARASRGQAAASAGRVASAEPLASERSTVSGPSAGGYVAATVELKPYGWGDAQGWVCCDPTPLDTAPTVPRDDFVLGVSPASTTLAQLTVRRPVGRALDLGTGCGVQTLHLSGHVDQVVATDLNPRALALARITLGLNGVAADLRAGSLYEPVADDRFDLIVTNPPYVMSPPDESHLVYREGGFVGDGLMREIVAGAPAHLNEGGLLQIVGNWAVTADEPWQDRLRSWIEPTGCDALVLRRESLDVYEYIELWLADAGLVGTPGYRAAYRRWLDYFASLGVTGVGMGWLSLRRAERDVPKIRIDDWPHAVAQPVGSAVGGFFDAVSVSRRSDADLLTAHLVVPDGVVQETYGQPGAADPAHLVLRQQTGLCRAVEAGTGLAAVVGACDGELPLGVLIGATAGLLGVGTDDLRDDLLPRVRDLLLDGFLRV